MDPTDFAQRLADATRNASPIEPLSGGDLTIDQAYEVQDAVLEHLNPGASRSVAKLGLTSRAKQEQMSVDEPLYGYYTDTAALDIGEPLIVSDYIQPRVEPEIAFITSTELSGTAVTSAHVLSATRAILPALDVLDSRFSGYRFTLPDVVADNASAARYLVGSPAELAGVDLSMVGCVFERNGEVIDTAAGAAVLDHPAAAVAWFVRKLAERGRALPAGSMVLSGALTAAVPVAPGDVLRVTIDRVGAAELVCR